MRNQWIIRAIFALIALPAFGNAGFVIAEKSQLSLVEERAAAVPMPPEHIVLKIEDRKGPLNRLAPARNRRTTALKPPMTRPLLRISKKNFGMEIHPATSPVPNDRFDGFHVGVDFETFANEKDVDVPVSAICDGRLLLKKMAKGYGGLAVQSCRIDGEDVTIIYGHLRLPSVSAEAGERLVLGETIGMLGTGGTEETDGVRKHLHLGIHLGPPSELDVRGYVKEAEETYHWLDPQALLWPEAPSLTE